MTAPTAMNLAREFRLDGVMLCAIEGSSIERGLQAMAAELTEVDVQLLSSVGSRMYSGWKEQ